MKVSLSQNIQQQQLNRPNTKPQNQNNNKNVSFKGAGVTAILDYLATNPVWGATATDVGFMGTPTTATEIIRRGWGYGFEAGFREYTSTLNDASVGLYGLGAGTILAGTLAKSGITNPQRIFASNESVDVHSSLWKANGGNVENYINSYVDSIKGFNPTSPKADANGYVGVAEECRQGIVDDMKILANQKLNKQDIIKVTQRLNAKLVEATGAESELLLKHGDKSVASTVTTVTDDFYRMTRALKETGEVSNVDKFVSALKKFGKGRALLGLGTAMAISTCFQPINVWMTKKRTGSTGFGGDETRTKDNSASFKAKKLASMGLMGGIMLATLKAKPSQFLDRMLFKGTAPTIDQFKGLYGTTILSRMWMGRDNDELREIDIKSILGYLNWLVLGNFVEKGVIMAKEDKANPLLRYNKENSKNGFLYKHFGEKVDKFFNSNITSRREIVTEALQKEGISVLNSDGSAKKMKQLLKDFETITNPIAKKNLKLKTMAQLAGYAYSGIVLGAGVPYLNISITNHVTAKRQAKERHAKAVEMAEKTFFENDIKNTSFAEIKKEYQKSA
ncbi:MAG: hypothetical protein K6E29_00565 [Cyanobacteria bacterium RUI128]|nr:hypothetical protein [Cyanobacteria bacterium RUI128]